MNDQDKRSTDAVFDGIARLAATLCGASAATITFYRLLNSHGDTEISVIAGSFGPEISLSASAKSSIFPHQISVPIYSAGLTEIARDTPPGEAAHSAPIGCLLAAGSTPFSAEMQNSLSLLAGQAAAVCALRGRIATALQSAEKNRTAGIDRDRRTNERRFRRMASNVLGIIYQFVEHIDGRKSFPIFGSGIREALGIDPASLQGSPSAIVFSLLHPDDAAGFYSERGRSRATLSPFIWQGRFRHAGTGEYRWFRAASMPELQEDGAIFWDGILTDINQEREALNSLQEREEAAAWQSRHDPLTGLSNRAHFITLLDAAIGSAAQDQEHQIGVMFLDLDGFKRINDMLGHATGDALLVRVAERLRAALPPTVSIARLGGDEFIFLLHPLSRSAEPRHIAEAILATFRDPHLIAGHELVVTASIGIAKFPL